MGCLFAENKVVTISSVQGFECGRGCQIELHQLLPVAQNDREDNQHLNMKNALLSNSKGREEIGGRATGHRPGAADRRENEIRQVGDDGDGHRDLRVILVASRNNVSRQPRNRIARLVLLQITLMLNLDIGSQRLQVPMDLLLVAHRCALFEQIQCLLQ